MTTINAIARVNGNPVGSVSNVNSDFKNAYLIAKKLAKDHFGARNGTVVVDIKNVDSGEIRSWEINQKVETCYLKGQKYFPLKQTSKSIPYKK